MPSNFQDKYQKYPGAGGDDGAAALAIVPSLSSLLSRLQNTPGTVSPGTLSRHSLALALTSANHRAAPEDPARLNSNFLRSEKRRKVGKVLM